MLDKAKLFAEKAHEEQKRKGTGEPYIVHPIRVAETLHQAGCKLEVICAAYLHDVVEDTIYELEDIEQEFGKDIMELVASHTEDKSKSWKERKQHTIDTVKTGSKDEKYLIVADKLDNLLSLEQELAESGDDVWRHFNAGFEEQRWYNESIAEVMYEGLEEKPPDFFHTFEEAVKRFFKLHL